MDKKVKGAWVKALLSGRYKQGEHRLATRDGKTISYCCLGVLARVQGAKINKNGHPVLGKETNSQSGFLDLKFACGLRQPSQRLLARLNDGGKSFKEIAAVIQKKY